jgi:hypothetical protein
MPVFIPLAAAGAVDVHGVAREEAAPLPVRRRVTAVDMEGRHPDGVAHGRARGATLRHRALEVCKRRLARERLRPIGGDLGVDPMPAVAQGEDEQRAVGVKEGIGLVVGQRPVYGHIRQRPALGVLRSLEAHAERVADRAVRAITANHPGRRCRLIAPVGMAQRRRHARLILAEAGQFHISLDPPAEALQTGAEDALRLALRQGEHEREGRVEFVETEMQQPASARVEVHAVQNPSAAHGLVCDAEIGEEFERARLHDDRLRCCGSRRRLVDQPTRHTITQELDCQGKPRRPRTDDEDRGRRVGVAGHGSPPSVGCFGSRGPSSLRLS